MVVSPTILNANQNISAKAGRTPPSPMEVAAPPLVTPTVIRSLTISQFCFRHQIGRTSYFQMRKTGLGPREIRVGRVIRISPDSEREWVDRMQSDGPIFGSTEEAANGLPQEAED